LYFHIPFCDTVCYYCACNKVITANKRRAQPYLDNLHWEMRLLAEKVDTNRPVQQLHWGGGTPTFISHQEMTDLMIATRDLFQIFDDDRGEYSIEVHPGRMSVDTVSHLRGLGFNRLSMGVQDFNPAVQQAVNRFNSVEQVSELVTRAREEGFHSLSMDLIYGLPLQTVESVRRTLDQVIELGPERLSLFNYAHMPHLFKTQRQIDASQLPAPEAKLQMLHMAIDRLCEAGYVYIGMDHFAKPGDELTRAQQDGTLHRNFQGYSTHGDCDLLAFGVSAISAIDNVYVQNHKDVIQYNHSLEHNRLPLAKGFTLSPDDVLRQHVINQLICQMQLDFAAVEREYSIDFANYFDPELAELQTMVADGLVEMDDKQLRITPQGRLLVRRVCMVFDRYLRESRDVRYSRII